MSAPMSANVSDLWLLTGWTMIHFMWLGTLVALAALLLRTLLRRASAGVRYTAALACMCALVALPLAIAVWIQRDIPQLATEARAGAPATAGPAAANLAPLAPIDAAATPQLLPNTQPLVELHAPAPAATAPADVLPITQPAAPPAHESLAAALLAINTCAEYLPWLWLIGAPITFALTATGLVGTRRLHRASRQIVEGPIADSLAALKASLKISRDVAVAVCDRIAAPVLIGIVRPMILLPPAALTGYSPEEIEMVLLHELAHVRRWDNLVNLVQRIIESVLFFHPAVWLISAWARREREACCDALVVARTDHPHAYA